MPRISNHELVNSLLVATDQDKVDWQPTARPQEFAASFGGKYTAEVWRGPAGALLDIKDSEGEMLVRISSEDDNRIPELHDMAKRHALKIDDALADLLKEINKPKN